MKERPILMNTAMVQATLADLKTQTRRVIKPQPDQHLDPDSVKGAWESGFIDVKCPYGQIGDRLWVRETFAKWWDDVYENPPKFVTYYRADGVQLSCGQPWIPSIHMPRSDSRIQLKITGIRVEQLQDISEEDALAEGICHAGKSVNNFDMYAHYGAIHLMRGHNPPENMVDIEFIGRTAKAAFEKLWISIYGADSWQKNPWVWVPTFERIHSS